MCYLEVRILGQSTVTIAHTVALDICLSNNIDTILVTQLIPTGIVGIVASTYCIDIKLLHDLYILYHSLYRHHITTIGIEFVAVGTLEEYSLTIYEHLIILELHLAEAHLLTDSLYHIVAIHQLNIQIIQVRSLGTPLCGIVHGQCSHGLSLSIDGSLGALHHLACSIFQCVTQHLTCCIIGRSRNLQRTVLVILVQVGEDEEVIHTHLGTSIHVHFTSDTGKAPEVLVFEV